MSTKGFLITISFAAAVSITFLGLYYNIQTVVLNEEVKSLKQQLWQLKKENKQLEISYLKRVRAQTLEKMATEKFGMIPERDGPVVHTNIFDK